MSVFPVEEYSRELCGSSHRVAKQIDRGKARADKNAEKRDISQSDKIHDVHALKKFNDKCEYHDSERDSVGAEPAGKKDLQKSVDCPHDYNVAEVIPHESAVAKKRYHDLDRGNYHK